MDQLGALIVLQKEIYKICTALVCITDIECCNYGFNDEVLTAKIYIEEYEKDNPYEET